MQWIYYGKMLNSISKNLLIDEFTMKSFHLVIDEFVW